MLKEVVMLTSYLVSTATQLGIIFIAKRSSHLLFLVPREPFSRFLSLFTSQP